ncbi:MAG: alpha/beta hydrolase [Acidobacteria bacterium]|nr:alpha/beta hydrolase [Acidobacteriota bacterium]MCI0723123.1 alpha/beta hydrolase [Acidobacteriota bacterium]
MRRLVFAVVVVSFLKIDVAWAQAPLKVIEKDDIIYGRTEGSGLLADIAYPEGKDRLPVILIVHGGRWRVGSKNDPVHSTKICPWAESGFFAMAINYRLVGATPAPASYQDLQTAIRWVHAHAQHYRIDANRIYLIGYSAGGHGVALAATLGEGPYPRTGGWENVRVDIRAAISVSAPYDLNTLSWGNLWTPLSGDVETARRIASPIRNIGSTTKPILIIHSDDDRSVPIQQAIDMEQALEVAKVPHKFIHYKDKGHVGLTDDVNKEARVFIAEVQAAVGLNRCRGRADPERNCLIPTVQLVGCVVNMELIILPSHLISCCKSFNRNRIRFNPHSKPALILGPVPAVQPN